MSNSPRAERRPGRSSLRSEVFVAPSIPVVTNDFAPGERTRPWPPIPSTLVYGAQDALVVDSFITQGQAEAQADWIASSGRRLTTIFSTHGHGDHFFGASVLLARFPGARFVAHADAVRVMREQVAPEFLSKFWEARFPQQLPAHLVIAQALSANSLELEGETLQVVPLGFTDTSGSTCLHVPSAGLLAPGDAVYNGVHPRLVESIQSSKLDEWISALDLLTSLRPKTVVAGHKDPRRPDDPSAISLTRQYITDFLTLVQRTGSRRQLYAEMLARYPAWLNRGALWSSAASAMGG